MGKQESLSSEIGAAGIGYSHAMARVLGGSEGPGGSPSGAVVRGLEDDPVGILQGIGMGRFMPVSYIPQTSILRRPINRAAGEHWARSLDISLGPNVKWEPGIAPRLDSWLYPFKTWAMTMAVEVCEFLIAHTLPQNSAVPRDSQPVVELREWRFGKIGNDPKEQLYLSQGHHKTYDLCLVMGGARAELQSSDFVQEVMPFRIFATDDPRGPLTLSFRRGLPLLHT